MLAYPYLPSEHAAAAEALLKHDPDWVAPLLWLSEFRNILAGHIGRNAISFEQTNSLQSATEKLFEGSDYKVSIHT